MESASNTAFIHTSVSGKGCLSANVDKNRATSESPESQRSARIIGVALIIFGVLAAVALTLGLALTIAAVIAITPLVLVADAVALTATAAALTAGIILSKKKEDIDSYIKEWNSLIDGRNRKLTALKQKYNEGLKENEQKLEKQFEKEKEKLRKRYASTLQEWKK